MRSRFPKTLREAAACFLRAKKCRELVACLRWPDGVICPSCGSSDIRDMPARSLWRCGLCRRQFSAKVGTIFEDSAIALHKWLTVVWAQAIASDSTSSHALARSLGITQKSAWLMVQRVRLASQAKGFRAPAIGGSVVAGAPWERSRTTKRKRKLRRAGGNVKPADSRASEVWIEFTRRLLNVTKAELDAARARFASEKSHTTIGPF